MFFNQHSFQNTGRFQEISHPTPLHFDDDFSKNTLSFCV